MGKGVRFKNSGQKRFYWKEHLTDEGRGAWTLGEGTACSEVLKQDRGSCEPHVNP